MSEPQLLRVPNHFRTAAEVLGTAAQMNLPKVLVLSETEDGRLVYLDNGMTVAETNWLIDHMKHFMLDPKVEDRSL